MVVVIQIISHVFITVIAVVGLALRVEHRLTKIETDVSWLKIKIEPLCKGDPKDDDDSKVDKS